ncbi:hypothetical protein ASZ90_014961 [hydrocarbon metagenome]|uniref:Uncharacterized protein n=1 Tax=hydrocarbon metagenome TaxID=938273 RepID=A0A0W8F3B2_9ZZZZ
MTGRRGRTAQRQQEHAAGDPAHIIFPPSSPLYPPPNRLRKSSDLLGPLQGIPCQEAHFYMRDLNIFYYNSQL